MFSAYFELGISHILDINGYDHMLFIIALCVIYRVSEWKRLLILVTAFTIGHATTLLLSVYDIVTVKASLVEFLIPLTILITAIHNLRIIKSENKSMVGQYLLAMFFGCIHGFGFSNFFKAISPDRSEMFLSFLAFNIGIELGQLLIVLSTTLISFLAINLLGVNTKYWQYFISILVALFAIFLIV